MKVYTDGSYDKKRSPTTTAFAAVVVKDETPSEYIVDIIFGVQKEPWVQMWNVGGELCGVITAIDYMQYKYHADNIELYFDYIGIEKWVTGEWKAKNSNTIAYRKHMEKIKEDIPITFIHVPGHSNILLNEVADKYAKYATELYLSEGKEIYLKCDEHIPVK